MNSNTIERLASDVIDTGRRGEPRPGCDCMQCFGYCLVDRDEAVRSRALANDGAWRGRSYGGLPAAVDEVLA
jgi:hypothetical protein